MTPIDRLSGEVIVYKHRMSDAVRYEATVQGRTLITLIVSNDLEPDDQNYGPLTCAMLECERDDFLARLAPPVQPPRRRAGRHSLTVVRGGLANRSRA